MSKDSEVNESNRSTYTEEQQEMCGSIALACLSVCRKHGQGGIGLTALLNAAILLHIEERGDEGLEGFVAAVTRAYRFQIGGTQQ